MKQTFFIWAAFCLLLLASSGCVQPVEIEPPAEREVFVKCILMKDTVQQVTLLYSGGIGDESFEPVSEAEVYILSPDHVRIFFQPVGGGVWENGFSPKAGGTYTLIVSIPGREAITATTRFPDDFSVIPKRTAPERWVSDMREVIGETAPGSAGRGWSFRYLVPMWMGRLRSDIPGWEESIPNGVISHSAIEDLEVLDRVAHYGGTTMQQEMPGMSFRVESDSTVRLYVLGTVTDENGNVSRITRLGTNHRRVDRSNLLPEAFCSGIDPEQASAPYVIDPVYSDHQYDNPVNRQTYDKAIKYSYEGQPLYADYLRIIAEADYDNGMKLYSIVQDVQEDERYTVEDPMAIVRPPYISPADNYGGAYHLFLDLAGKKYFSLYGDFDFSIWKENETAAHPSLYFCSVSPEYDQYLQSVRGFLHQRGDVLSLLYGDVRNGFSNIDGGYGIFGAVRVLRHDCDARFTVQYIYPGIFSGYDWSYDYPAYPAQLPEL